MKHHYFTAIEETGLPEVIKESFNDSFEKAHLRRLEDVFYLILNYPLGGIERYVICLRVKDNTLTLYAPESLRIKLNGLLSIPDVLMSMVNEHEIKTSAIADEVKQFELEMEDLVSKDHVMRLYDTQKSIIYIMSGVHAIERIVDTIQTTQYEGFYLKSDVADFASITIETQQTLETLKMQEKMIHSLMQSSESLFSNRLNETMKRLTSIALIFSVPVFITGFFGMNIEIPFQSHPDIMMFVLVGSTLATALITLYFRKKDLL